MQTGYSYETLIGWKSETHSHGPSIRSNRRTQVVWPDFLENRGLHSSLSEKSSFFLPAFEISRSCRTASEKKHFCSSMGTNGGSVAMDSVKDLWLLCHCSLLESTPIRKTMTIHRYCICLPSPFKFFFTINFNCSALNGILSQKFYLLQTYFPCIPCYAENLSTVQQ